MLVEAREIIRKIPARAILRKVPNVGFSLFAAIYGGPYAEAPGSNADLIFPTPIVRQELPPTYHPKLTIVKYSEELQQNMILSSRQAWSDGNWFPEFEETAKAKNLPRLHDDWWIFHMHDILNWQVLGQASFTLQWGRDENKRIVEAYQNDPIQVHAAGHCPELAIVEAVEPDPGNGKWFHDQWFDRQYLVGFLIAKHIGDRLIQVPLSTAAALKFNIEQGQPVIVNAPEEPGVWWRAVNGISEDGQWVQVTNFGYPDKIVPFSMITDAYIPFPNDSLTLNPSVTFRFRGNGRVSGLNRQLIDMIVYQ